MTIEIRSAIEREARRGARRSAVLHEVWQQFLDHGGPVPIADVERAMRGPAADDVRGALKALDDADLLLIAGDAIQLAYPFTTGPNQFAVELANGGTRYSCCAIDPLGLAPMLGEPLTIRSRCHHSGAPLVIAVDPDGPRSPPQTMVWIAPRDACGPRAATGL
jgi:hypothetical protein